MTRTERQRMKEEAQRAAEHRERTRHVEFIGGVWYCRYCHFATRFDGTREVCDWRGTGCAAWHQHHQDQEG